jgi:hypothetical protein
MQQGVTPEMKRITKTDFGKWPDGEKIRHLDFDFETLERRQGK